MGRLRWQQCDACTHALPLLEACGSACIILRRSYTGMYNIHTFERASEAFFKGLATITNSIYRKHKQVLLIISINFKKKSKRINQNATIHKNTLFVYAFFLNAI